MMNTQNVERNNQRALRRMYTIRCNALRLLHPTGLEATIASNVAEIFEA